MTPTLFTALNFSVIASSTTAAVPLKRSSDVVITSSPNLHCLETEAVLAASKKLLGASVAMIGDVARSTHHLGGYETAIELKGLTIREIVAAPLSEEDRAKGVTRRYLAHVSYKSHRIWDEPMRSWTEWREIGYGFFPSQVIVEEIAGNFSARANRIADFVPGIETGLALPS